MHLLRPGSKRMLVALSLGLTATGAMALGSCGLIPGSTFEDETTLSEEVTEVQLDLGNGRVTLRGEEGATETSVHREVEYRGRRPDEATHRFEDGVLVLGGCGQGCSVSYTVDLAAGVAVTGKTSNGAVSLTGVGEVEVRTSNGRITLDGASGPVGARSSNGAIEVTLATPQDVRAETSNGAITVTVPEGSYQVSAQTGNGRQDIDIANDPSGTHQLDLTTSNGSITVEHP